MEGSSSESNITVSRDSCSIKNDCIPGLDGTYFDKVLPNIRRKRSSYLRKKVENPSKRFKDIPLLKAMAEHKGTRKDFFPFLIPHSDSLYCNASVLVTEPHRCYRVEGVKVTLECFSSKHWYIVARNGLTAYMHKAVGGIPKVIPNYFTGSLVWRADHNWMLELSGNKELKAFEELHRECVQKNVEYDKATQMESLHFVREVQSNANSFQEEHSYISVEGDEVSRALANPNPNYDMDSEDEKWLEDFNKSLRKGKGGVTYVSMDTFERLIDTFEIDAYQNSGSLPNETKAVSLCSDLGTKKIVVAAHKYWRKKRKQKQKALVEVFRVSSFQKARKQQYHDWIKSMVEQGIFEYEGGEHSDNEASEHETDEVEENVDMSEASEHETYKVEDDVGIYSEYKQAVRHVEDTKEKAKTKRMRAEDLWGNAEIAIHRAAMALLIAEATESSNAIDISSVP